MARKDKERDQGGPPPADDGWGTHVHGTRPIAGASPAGAGPGVVPGLPSSEAQPGRARTGRILLVSFLVQLVVVLAAGNTAVVRNGLDYSADHRNFLGAFGSLPSVYAWRLTPPANNTSHVYEATLFGLLAFFVVAALLTLALVRGPITFWRAAVGVWLSVIVATLAGGMVRRGLIDVNNYRAVGGKAVAVVFQGNGFEVVAGAITGLLAALAAAIVAVVSRRPADAVVPLPSPEAAPYVEPAAPPPWHGDDPAPRTGGAPSFQKPPQDDNQATTRFPVAGAAAAPAAAAAAPPAGEPSGATTRLRREDVGEYGPSTVVSRQQPDEAAEPRAKAPEQVTTQLPAQSRPMPLRSPEPEPKSEPEREPETPSERPAETPSERPAERSETPAGQPHRPDRSTQSTQAMPAQSTQAMPAFPRPPDDEDLGHQPEDY